MSERTREIADAPALRSDDDARCPQHVSLQLGIDLAPGSRAARGTQLRQALAPVAALVAQRGGRVLEETLSVSGQLVEAVLAADGYDETVRLLCERGVRVDLLRSVQAVQGGLADGSCPPIDGLTREANDQR
ncbi:MAG: hypothetical protein AAF772_11080 [Acidobacteriota bacterium]